MASDSSPRKSRRIDRDVTDPSLYLSSDQQAAEPSRQLCSHCRELNIATMFREEQTKEESIGTLSDFANQNCPLCNLISKAICLAWDIVLSGDSTNVCPDGKPLQLFMRSRSPWSIKKNGLEKHPLPRLLLAVNQKPPNFPHDRAIIPQIDRVNDRFVIAEIESLPHDSMSQRTSQAPCFSRRDIEACIDVQLVKRWLQDCGNHRHPKRAGNQGSNGLFKGPGFRLIDVIDERLMNVTETCDYVALSYIWGKIPSRLLTKKSNVDTLSASKGITSLPTPSIPLTLPLTLSDAMDLTRKIGMRYLWVDALCIVQDDPEDRAKMIPLMNEVYDNAALTIIAAAGSHANAGLMGISPRKGCPIEPTTIVDREGGTTLKLAICLPSLSEIVRKSTWNKRGWTHQEQCLSQRCLYFTDEEVFFSCSEKQWREGYFLDDMNSQAQIRTGPPWWTGNLREDLDPTPHNYLGKTSLNILDYQSTVKDYSRRELSYPSDILNAFAGIFSRFIKSENTPRLTISQTQGIPVHFLFQAILWFPSGGARRCSCSTPQFFSTWSWASWTGPVEFVFDDNTWLSRTISYASYGHVPIIRWYHRDSDGELWPHADWIAAPKAKTGGPKHVSDRLSRTKTYLEEQIGIDVDKLVELDHSQSSLKSSERLISGSLGFFGAYLSARKECFLGIKKKQKGTRHGTWDIWEMCVADQKEFQGEFRFDDGEAKEAKEVDEFVAIVAADKISNPFDPRVFFLGLVTQDGISTRVGIGFINCARASISPELKWQYKFFRIR